MGSPFVPSAVPNKPSRFVVSNRGRMPTEKSPGIGNSPPSPLSPSPSYVDYLNNKAHLDNKAHLAPLKKTKKIERVLPWEDPVGDGGDRESQERQEDQEGQVDHIMVKEGIPCLSRDL